MYKRQLPILGYEAEAHEGKIKLAVSEKALTQLTVALEKSFNKPNPQLAGKRAIESWLGSHALRDLWEIEDSNLVNQIMDDLGLDHKISHLETLKVMEAIRKDWIAKHSLELPLEHDAKRLDSLENFEVNHSENSLGNKQIG